MSETAQPTALSRAAEQSAIEEKFPRIAEALCTLWGHGGYAPYLKSLVFDERGNRQGFPADVSMELFMLQGLLDIQMEGDVWTKSDHRI